MVECVDCIFIFSLVWSLGGNIPVEGRTLFNNYLGKKVAD